MILQNVTSNNSIAHQQLFNLHYINLTDQHSVSIHLEIESLNRNLSYLLIYKFDRIPQLTDNWTLFCSENLSNENTFTYFIDNQQTKQHQSFIFGLRELTPNESINFCSNSTISVPIINSRHNFTSNYKLRTYTSGCYYLDTDGQWQSDGLRVGSQTNHNRTQCFSTHLTTFAGGFNVLPEPVNWQYVFANADFMKNKTIYSTVICISAIYLILLVFARHKDKKDIEKLGVTPLLDNHSEDRYYYQLIVFTGRRKNAGTKSRVQFILSGDHDETHVRTLADSKRTILQRGGIDAFVVAVPKCLGPLSHIRIWHDNSGSGEASSWFLKYILVRDLQTMEKFHFIAQRWFAVEHDDGKIERTLPVASHLEKSEFSYLLSKQAYHNVSDGHLWFSIFSRPASPRFTRVQRCTCCFVLLFVSMFLNIMYYDLKSSTSTSGLTIGPLFIGIEQIVIGIIVELCALIPSLLLVQIFRRLRSRRPSISALHQTVSQLKPNTTIKSQSSNKSFTFPWWFIFIAYGLSIILVGVSILFIIARGIEFGDTKTQQWLISIVTSFCSSVLLTQPLKILALSIVFICLCRKSDDDQTANEYLDENQLDLDDNEEYLHSKIEPIFISRSKIPTTRLDETELELARQDRLKEIRMWSVIRETLTYLIFLSLIFAITYSHRTTDTFQQVNHLRKYFRSKSIVYSINDYWTWLETNFVDKIRAQQWYNNDIPLNLNGYINDKTNRLIGWGLMRQLRIQSDLCPYDKLSLTCSFEYDKSNEETNSFEIGWLNRTITKGNTSIEKAFEYQSSQQLDSYVYQGEHGKYSGGGYVYEFRGRLSEIKNNLSELHRFGWIDTKTRAILIQLNLYNPNAQLFTSVSILTEFLSTGGTATRTRFEPMNFYLTLNSWTQLICLIVYLCFIIYLMFGQMKLIHQLKFNYLRQFWSLIELGIIICSWMAIGIYILRYREYYRIGQLFNQSKGYAYINLQYSTYLNDYLTFIYAFCCFFGTLKLVRLCRFSPRLYLFIQTLESATQKLIAFAFMFTIVFIGFICLFYFLFQSTLFSCSTILQTIRMLFEMTLMKFDVYELINVSPVLGPLAFSFFIFIVVFVCMSMFLSIINDSFQRAKENAKQDQEHIYSFMIERFLRWIDWKKQRTEDETHEEYDVRMRDQYFHPIEGFPEKVDQLFEVLNQIYVSQVDRQTKRE